MKRIPLALWALLFGASCEAEPWVVATQANWERDGDRRDAGPPPSMIDQCPTVEVLRARRIAQYPRLAPSAAHVGRWRGTLSGSSAAGFPGVDVQLSVDTDGSGSFRFESESPLVPPGSAAEAYLCDGSVSGGICGSASGFVGGFDYAIEAARSRGDVLSFVIVDADPWDGWCRLQEATQRSNPDAECGLSWDALPGVPRWSSAGCELAVDGVIQPIDCGRMYALERCACGRDGCIASFTTAVDVGLLGSPGGDVLEGALWFKNGAEAASLRLLRER